MIAEPPSIIEAPFWTESVDRTGRNRRPVAMWKGNDIRTQRQCRLIQPRVPSGSIWNLATPNRCAKVTILTKRSERRVSQSNSPPDPRLLDRPTTCCSRVNHIERTAAGKPLGNLLQDGS